MRCVICNTTSVPELAEETSPLSNKPFFPDPDSPEDDFVCSSCYKAITDKEIVYDELEEYEDDLREFTLDKEAENVIIHLDKKEGVQDD